MPVPETVHCISPCESEADVNYCQEGEAPLNIPRFNCSFPDVGTFPTSQAEECGQESFPSTSSSWAVRYRMDSMDDAAQDVRSGSLNRVLLSPSAASMGMLRTKSFRSNLCNLASLNAADPVPVAVQDDSDASTDNAEVQEDCWGFFVESNSHAFNNRGKMNSFPKRRRHRASPYFVPVQPHQRKVQDHCCRSLEGLSI